MKRGQEEDGFTMVVTVIAMSVLALLVLVAVTAVNGDARLTSRDLMRKQAYEAAKAGLDEYAFRLHAYTGYWAKCDQAQDGSAVNQKGSTAKRRSVPGMPTAQYAIELIPATGYSSCDPTNLATATASMLQSTDPMKGTFRIRSNGYAGDSHVAIMATFKPASFLDYVYFTQYETSDPVSYATEELKYGAEQQCEKFLRDGRTSVALKNKAGQEMNDAGGVYESGKGQRRKYCTTISFVSGDNIKGPMHTNDAFVICQETFNKPILGRTIADPVEVGAGSPGWYPTNEGFLNSGSNCGGKPEIKGQFQLNSAVIIPPETNSELSTIAEPVYRFSGEVSICLNGATLNVGKGKSCNEKTLPFPTNGVIYVSSIACSGLYTPFNVSYSNAVSECGNVNLSGTYSKPLTIAAANDVIITNNVTKSSEEGMLGLIANNFIRIYHPVKLKHPRTCNSSGVCTEDLTAWECGGSNEPGYVKDITIEAALLAIKHSFIVDNYDCGGSLGTLNVKGAIAQKFRGAVGTTGGTGYIKNYEYDERLKTTEPPSFIQPVKSDWVIGRETTE